MTSLGVVIDIDALCRDTARRCWWWWRFIPRSWQDRIVRDATARLTGPLTTICQVCGNPLARGLLKHPHCRPRVVTAENAT